ncbi:dihydrolipoyl dehydrogenase [Terasakiella sp.]|uniref:dihydrolipoyl dehydrogenase n=1 Tax=Terasakiella sp. TaxID=2034861 RepID=UPI003AA87BBF
MPARKVDIAIIGAGTAGMGAYREATKVTDNVVLIEGGEYGTTCARVGCMPSKLLIAAAEAAHFGGHTQPFGVTYQPPKIDGKAVMARVKSERDRFVGFVKEDVEGWDEVNRIRAYAKFIDDHHLELSDGQIIEADRVVIATGSSTFVPPPFKAFEDRLIVNDDVFDWDDLPESVVIFGAGVIGLELGQALHRLGVRVSLFGRDYLVGPLTDDVVKFKARETFMEEFPFYPHGEVTRMENVGDHVEIDFVEDGETKTDRFEYALIATGRRPNVDKLGLENTSIKLDERGVPHFVLATGQTSASHIFIAGDAGNNIPLLHEAADEGKIVGYNAARYPEIRAFTKSSPIAVMFSDPQIMMVGESYKALEKRNANFAVGSVDFKGQGRSRVMLVNNGILRVYGEKGTGRFLGAEMVGPRAEHIAHLLAWAHQSELTVSEMLDRPFYHPVVEEGVRTALRDLNNALELGPVSPARCIDCGPGA